MTSRTPHPRRFSSTRRRLRPQFERADVVPEVVTECLIELDAVGEACRGVVPHRMGVRSPRLHQRNALPPDLGYRCHCTEDTVTVELLAHAQPWNGLRRDPEPEQSR